MFGLGSALLVLSLGSLILPVKQVVALSAVLFLASTLTKSVVYRGSVRWRDALALSLISFPFAWLGGMALDMMPAALLRKILGAMVLAWLLMSVSGYGFRGRPGPLWLGLGAGAYGFVSGLLGSGNLVKSILFRQMALAGEGFVGMMAATAVLANLGKLTAYIQGGLLRPDHWPMAAALTVAAVAAVFIGRFWLRRLGPRWFHTGLHLVLAVSAIALLL